MVTAEVGQLRVLVTDLYWAQCSSRAAVGQEGLVGESRDACRRESFSDGISEP